MKIACLKSSWMLDQSKFWTKQRIFILLVFGSILFLFIMINVASIDNNELDDKQILLYWTPYLQSLEYVVRCGNKSCFVTSDRSYLRSPNLKSLLFYGSNLNISDLPLPRKTSWALYHEESPKNIPLLSFYQSISAFNYTATFSRYSDIPLTLQYLPEISYITDMSYYRTIEDQNYLQKVDRLAPILYLQTICDTLSERDMYIRELMKYIRIDSYGKCLNNKPKSEVLGYLSESKEALRFMSRYKFMISYENAVCDDYISEKFWRAIHLGVIPIYFGSPTIRDWLPNPKSAVLIDDFLNPKELANYIKLLNNNDQLYLQHLQHKISPNPISNHFLLDKTYRKYFVSSNHQQDFECMVCEGQYKSNFRDSKEYKCMLKYPRGITPKKQHLLRDAYLNGKCEATVFLKHLKRNKSFTKKALESDVRELMLSEKRLLNVQSKISKDLFLL